MVNVKSPREIEKMRYAAQVLKKVLTALCEATKPGVTPQDLDVLAGQIIHDNQCESNFKGYYGFPANICVSVNNRLIHGIPNQVAFQSGDLVSIDAGCKFEGYHSDSAITVIVGEAKNATDQQLVDVTQQALEEAIKIIKPGVRIGTIGATIQQYVEGFGFKLPTSYTGHGIGRELHEDPFIPNVGIKDTGMRLHENMVICIEPMVQIGTAKTRTLADQWTVESADGSNTAHFEHTILVTKDGCEVLTR